jgi:hypothetical protein
MSISLPAQDLQGTIVKRRDVPGFRLTENLYGEGFSTRQHFHHSGLFGCVIRRLLHERIPPGNSPSPILECNVLPAG